MAALPQLIPVEEFLRLPKGGEYQYELHHGEVVASTRPRARHQKLQLRLSRLLAARLRTFGEVATEVPYRPVPEFEYRVADVAAVSWARWEAIDPDDNLHGAPELVIEVKSPSNSERQLRELVSIALNHGALECWIVDSGAQSVTVVRRDGVSTVYAAGAAIPLAAFGADQLAVAEIFA